MLCELNSMLHALQYSAWLFEQLKKFKKFLFSSEIYSTQEHVYVSEKIIKNRKFSPNDTLYWES